VAPGGGTAATRREELALPFSLRRCCHGTTTFIQSSRVPIIEIAVPKVQDERSKEILREFAKLNPEDPREAMWAKV